MIRLYASQIDEQILRRVRLYWCCLNCYFCLAFRSYAKRQQIYQKLRNEDLKKLLNEINEIKKKTKKVDFIKLNKIISIIVFTSKCGIDENIISAVVSLIVASTNKFGENEDGSTATISPLILGYFINELILYMKILCDDYSPRLGPTIRALEKILDAKARFQVETVGSVKSDTAQKNIKLPIA